MTTFDDQHKTDRATGHGHPWLGISLVLLAVITSVIRSVILTRIVATPPTMFGGTGTTTPALLASALGGVFALGFIAGLILIGDAVLRRFGR